MKKLFLLITTTLILSSCGSSYQARQRELGNIWNKHFTENFVQTRTVEVLVATNRNQKRESFGCFDNDFGVTLGGEKLQFGRCDINVPQNHRVGEIPSEEQSPNLSKSFKVMSFGGLDEKELVKKIRDKKTPVLVFVHGFNVKYNEAVYRAAQISYDLKYQGPIVLFTWPSGSKDGFLNENLLNKTYEQNLASAVASVNIFKNFLKTLNDEDIEVNLIVHSMGHQVVLQALADLNNEDHEKIYVNRLILNAPDFSATDFNRIAKNLRQASNNATLYCSYNDKAMTASNSMNSATRAGSCFINSDVIDVINVSAVDNPTLGLGHSYYSSRPILSDISLNLLGIPAEKRLFIVKSENNNSEKYVLRD